MLCMGKCPRLTWRANKNGFLPPLGLFLVVLWITLPSLAFQMWFIWICGPINKRRKYHNPSGNAVSQWILLHKYSVNMFILQIKLYSAINPHTLTCEYTTSPTFICNQFVSTHCWLTLALVGNVAFHGLSVQQLHVGRQHNCLCSPW